MASSDAQKSFTDIFIRRPVLATVISLLILFAGLQAGLNLAVRQFPELTQAAITINTFYPGADAELVQGFITTPIQQAVASTEGVDYIKSSSTAEQSSITLQLRLNANADAALTEVLTKINQVGNILPDEANDPIVTKVTADSFALMYLAFRSDEMTPAQITEYLRRVIQPALQAVEGVGNIEILGAKTYSMRIWLNPQRMAALNVTPDDVSAAIRRNNFVSAAGRIKGDFIQVSVNADTDLSTPEAFANLVVAVRDDTLIRIRDIAEVALGPESGDAESFNNRQDAVFLGIGTTPGSNPLAVADGVHAALPDIEAQMPTGMEVQIGFDGSRSIREAISEVVFTIFEAAAIVIVVIFLFLGNLRATLVPIVTIPLSLVGVLIFLAAIGYSINLLTLLALVLAIGLVVDDAIVVLENIHRHIEEGLTPFDAAIKGAREIVLPIIAMTATLAAVYTPIGFLGGLTGTLFREFAFTLAGAVIVSGVIALTLSPMMTSRFLKAETATEKTGVLHVLDRLMDRFRDFYEGHLFQVLENRPVIFVFAAGIVALSVLMFTTARNELAPAEDNGFIFMLIKGPPTANIDYMTTYTDRMGEILMDVPEREGYFMLVGGPSSAKDGRSGLILKPWSERERSAEEVLSDLQPKLSGIAGVQVQGFIFPPLPSGSDGPPVQFILKTTADYETLFNVLDELGKAAAESGLFIFSDIDLRFDTPEYRVTIDSAKANQLGIRMSDIGAGLATLLGGNFVNRFSLQGRSYQVIPQVPRDFRLTADWLPRYQLRTQSGEMVPLSTVVSIDRQTQPNALTQFQQQNSGTLIGAPFPGRTMGEVLEFLNDKAAEIMPDGFSIDYAGEARQYVEEGSSLVAIFGFAMVVIFLVLAAQFESWRDPFIILVSVPMSVFGALLPLTLGLGSINIYTQVGLVTLIGLISKHGILMVEFANRLQISDGLNRRQAIVRAAAVRLRPIMMTTAAMVMGVIPLLTATGAGAASRFQMGLVIAAGMTIGTIFTLFVLPAVYVVLARKHYLDVGRADAS